MDKNLVIPEKDLKDLFDAFDAIQMPRSAYVLEHMVVHGEDSDCNAYMHCVLEMQIKWDDLRIVRLQCEIKKYEIDAIEKLAAQGDEIAALQAQIKRIELEQTNRARLGAVREFEALYKVWLKFPHKYTHEELEADQQNYWRARLRRQANQELFSTGRVGVGNLEALRQIGEVDIPIDFLSEMCNDVKKLNGGTNG